MAKFIWHEDGIPEIAIPVIVKTNYVGNYAIGCFNEKWWLKKGNKYVEHTTMMRPNEKITGWAYIGGEDVD